MGLPLLIIGLLMVITGGRGTYAQFGSQVASEFQGTNNFTTWILAIGSVGALGYVPELRTISRWLLTLVILVLFLSHKGFFAQFQAALKTGPTAPAALPASSGASIVSPQMTSPGVTPTNPSGGNVLNFGSAGTLNTNPIVPGGMSDKFLQFFGFGGSGTPLTQ